MNNNKILILGATGAMAVYLIPELLKSNYRIDGVSLENIKSHSENLTYIQADAKNMSFLENQLKNGYAAIIDFMIYESAEIFEKYYKLFLENTQHYIFLSSYRVYADDSPLNESSKRLWDIKRPPDFKDEYEYSIYKAQEEDILNNSPYSNYTIIRPAITYSKRRFQLTILEADVAVHRMLCGKTVVLPESAMKKQTTMTWAGDVAKMITALLFNKAAFRQTFNVATSEHMTWEEVAEIYKSVCGLKYITVDNETFLKITANGATYARQQLLYDRCFDRIVDNSKILKISGMEQSDLTPLEKGLKSELKNITADIIGCNHEINDRMDAYLKRI